MKRASENVWLAWAGWRLEIPHSWRVLKVSGDCARGTMMVGDQAQAIFQMKWWRRGRRRFKAQKWIRKRLRSTGPKLTEEGEKEFSDSFREAVLASDPSGVDERLIFYGYSPGAGLVLEMVVNGAIGKHIRRRVRRDVLPSIETRRLSQRTPWAVFDTSFLTPAGMDLKEQKLNLGDISLLLTAKDGRRLVARQVYPASLALKRRKLGRWLQERIYKERRLRKLQGEPRELALDMDGARWLGEAADGRKVIQFPLGWISPRRTWLGGVVDEGLDRMLLVEYDHPKRSKSDRRAQRGDDEVKAILEGMNWARRGVDPS